MLSSTLDEGRRREYLAALGVPLFRARRELPGAAIPVIESEPVVAEAALPASVQASAASRKEADFMAGSAVRLLVPMPPTAPVQPVATVPTVPKAMQAAPLQQAAVFTEPAPRFACRLMPVGEHGFVLLDLGRFPDVVAGEVLNLPAPEQQLWRNLQRALDWYPGEPEPDFIWPRAVKGLLGDDAETARDMLSAWLKRQIPAPARLWVFGEALAPFVTRPHRLMPSLADMLASPLAKRQAWQQLSQTALTS